MQGYCNLIPRLLCPQLSSFGAMKAEIMLSHKTSKSNTTEQLALGYLLFTCDNILFGDGKGVDCSVLGLHGLDEGKVITCLPDVDLVE